MMNFEKIKQSIDIVSDIDDEDGTRLGINSDNIAFEKISKLPFYKIAPKIRRCSFKKDNFTFRLYRSPYIFFYMVKPIKTMYPIKEEYIVSVSTSVELFWNIKLGQFMDYRMSKSEECSFDNIFDALALIEHCLNTDNYVINQQ